MHASLRDQAEAGYRVWSEVGNDFGVAFVGRGADRSRREIFALAAAVDRPIAWLRQIHGAAVLDGSPGCVAEGDALTTTRRDLALAISTADCVPVVLVAPGRVAAVHAGWRGIVAGVVAQAVAAFEPSRPAPRAWIGPAIGPCCYEVGAAVADEVARAANDGEVIHHPRGAPRPHLDLRRAVRAQLLGSGVAEIRVIETCTRCSSELHSYRRDGSTGRNLAFAWLR